MNQTQKLIVGVFGGLFLGFIVWLIFGEEEIQAFIIVVAFVGVFEYFFWKSPKKQEND